MLQYKLITFYNRGDESYPMWDVYGHRGFGDNDSLGEYQTEEEAMKRAHSFLLPVMRGESSSYVTDVMKKLF